MPKDLTLRDIELELRRRELEDPIGLTYVPHAGQVEAHQSRKNITLVLGANRAGKSWFAVAEAIYYCLGRRVHAEVPEGPVVVWYVMPSLTMFRRTVHPIFKKLAPWGEIRKFDERNNVVYFYNLSELHFLSADMRQRRLQGASVDLAIMDETPDKRVYEELLARVTDRKGRIIVVFAPIDEQSFWIRDELYIPWVAGDRKDVDVISMPVADRDGNSLVPHLDREDIARMMRQWPDPAVQAARIFGEFITRSGTVFRSYDPDVHLIERFEIPDEFTRWFMVDPQYHRFACLYYAADSEGNYYVTDEYFSQDENLAHRANRMSAIAGDKDRSVPVYVDSANQQDIAELNWHFSRIKAPFGAVQLPFQKRVDDMILRTHSMLEPDDERTYPKVTKRSDCYGAPRLFFFSDLMSTWQLDGRTMYCSRLLWEMQRLVWGKNGKPNKDSADGADCTDCLIYGTSIKATGVRYTEPDAWMRGLSQNDIMLWKLIDSADKYQKLQYQDER